TDRGPGHRQRVDRVRLTPRASSAALLGHQLRGHPHHSLPRIQQVDLQPGRQMTAVLDRPHQLGPEAFLSPSDRLVMPLGHGLDRDLPELAAGLIDRHERVGALVHVGADNNHGGCLLHLISDWTVGPAGGHISVGAVPRSYQVTPAGSLTPSAGTTHARQPEDDTEAMSQTPGDRDPTTATRAATLTLTLTRGYRHGLAPGRDRRGAHARRRPPRDVGPGRPGGGRWPAAGRARTPPGSPAGVGAGRPVPGN